MVSDAMPSTNIMPAQCRIAAFDIRLEDPRPFTSTQLADVVTSTDQTGCQRLGGRQTQISKT